MEKTITIKYKIKDNIILGTDEKGNDKIIYLKESIPNNENVKGMVLSLNKDNHKVLISMNEININVGRAIQRMISSITNEENDPNLIDIFVFLLQIKLYKEYILNRLVGNIPSDDYAFLKNTYRLDNILAEYLTEISNNLNGYRLKIIDLLTMNPDLKNMLSLLFKDITLKTNSEKLKDIYKSYREIIKQLFNQLQSN